VAKKLETPSLFVYSVYISFSWRGAMYISMKKHILSNSIMFVALLRIFSAASEGLIRFFIKKSSTTNPDMVNSYLWNTQIAFSVLQILITITIFFLAWKKLNHYMTLIPESDQKEMGDLQKEFLGNNIASLSVSSISRLLQLWAVIFVGAELIYDFSSVMYRQFISILMEALSSGTGLTDGSFVMLYNMTHGFKYLEILSAILLGVVMTGIFLNDKFLKLLSVAIIALFLLAFGVFNMQTVSLMGREIGIVWTSIIYHATETLGLALFSFYLSKRYKGL
jgi:hypothetical protein